jgi:uncharacterized phage protein (TIGR02218 family)
VSHDTHEDSVELGSPVEYYHFVRGTEEWAYTTGITEETIDSVTYLPSVITRGRIQQNDEIKGATLDIGMDRTNALVTSITADPDSIPISFVLYQRHVGETVPIIKFIGQLVSFSWVDGQAALQVASVENMFAREIPRVSIQKACPFMLYDGNCRAIVGSHTHTAEVLTVDTSDPRLMTVYNIDGGASDTLIGASETTFELGVLKKGNARRFIARHLGNVIYLLTPLAGIDDGDSIILIKGCDRLAGTCEDRFDNIENFGGFPNLPTQNPHVTME